MFFIYSKQTELKLCPLPDVRTDGLPLVLGRLSAGHEQLGWVIGSGSGGRRMHLMGNFWIS